MNESWRQRARREVGVALGVAAIGGVAFGLAEALANIEDNAVIHPDQYFFGYLALPLLTWIGLAAAALVPVALGASLVRRRGGAPWTSGYAGVLGAVGGAAIAVPWIGRIVGAIRSVGAEPTLLQTVALDAIGVALVAGAAALGVVLAGRVRDPERFARRARWTVVVLALLLSVPNVTFLLTDWRFAALAPKRPEVPAGRRPPNVLLVSIDTLRADHLGAYGSTRGLTPRLDGVAAAGVVFERAITSAPWTLPAMASLLTGRYPHGHGAGWVTNSRDPLARSALSAHVPTLATLLHGAGLRTAAIVTNPYLTLRYGVGEGFDSYENLTVQSEMFVGSRDVTAMRLVRWAWPGIVIGDRADTVTARATAWLRGQRTDEPFFLWVHYLDPHPPYSRPGVTRDKSFRGDALAAAHAPGLDLRLSSPDVARLRSGEIRLDAAEKEAVRDLYRAEVATVDGAVGTLLDALDREGLAAGTLVIVVADHGEEFWEHGGVEHGHTTYDELVHVPLILRWPERLPARRVPTQVRLIDVLPTVLDLLGVPAPAEVDGRSLVPLLASAAPSDPPSALVECMLFADERVAVRTEQRKFVRWETGKQEIYDLQADPAEHRDLAGLADERAALTTAFDAIRDASAGTRPPLAGRPGVAEAAALRALGYVE